MIAVWIIGSIVLGFLIGVWLVAKAAKQPLKWALGKALSAIFSD
jgi:uncharacterized protein YneF (UPF0154 family)